MQQVIRDLEYDYSELLRDEEEANLPDLRTQIETTVGNFNMKKVKDYYKAAGMAPKDEP